MKRNKKNKQRIEGGRYIIFEEAEVDERRKGSMG